MVAMIPDNFSFFPTAPFYNALRLHRYIGTALFFHILESDTRLFPQALKHPVFVSPVDSLILIHPSRKMCEQASLAWRRTKAILRLLSYAFKRAYGKPDQDIALVEDLMMLMFLDDTI